MPSAPASSTIEISFPAGAGAALAGALAVPDGPGPHPGVLVVADVRGLTDDTRRICGILADAGYAALAPDLYSRGSKPLCVARVLFDGLLTRAHGGTLGDLHAAREHLAGLPDVDASRLGIIGFCMGGGFALSYACARDGISAASINYGRVAKERGELATACPVVGSYGALDKVFTPDAARLEEHLAALDIPHDVKVYEGVGHSFMNDLPAWVAKLPSPMHTGYDEAAAAHAWARILAFFAEHI